MENVRFAEDQVETRIVAVICTTVDQRVMLRPSAYRFDFIGVPKMVVVVVVESFRQKLSRRTTC